MMKRCTAGVLMAVVAGIFLSACASKGQTPAPIEDRKSTGVKPASPSSAANAPTATNSNTTAVATKPGAENAGKPGYYTVKSGDTLYRIGLDNGQAWADVARWNALSAPYLIEVGQVLRVAPPPSAAVSSPIKPSAGLPSASVPPVSASAPNKSAAESAASEDVPSFIWPSAGAVLAGFDEIKNKGIDFAGKAGDAVLAAADGKVVYAGAGLRGYGNLIILKHNSTYLTAYAHNQILLVKEDVNVKKGQKIAEMGNTESERVKLHFELRKSGRPVDPARYLPIR